MNYTEEQKDFINDNGHNILVSAAAGSGKTAVIVERVIRLITREDYSVTDLLIVTFTKAAAAEMRERIRDAISERLMSEELSSGIREHLSDQLTLIYTADINTIDSFCLNLVREHFNICHIDPSFRVADEGELKLIAGEVMDKLLEDRYESGDEAFYSFVDYASIGRDDSGVADAIRSVYKFAVARPDPEGFISSMMKEYKAENEAELEETRFMKELLDTAREKLRLIRKILNTALEICGSPGGPYVYSDAIESDIELINALEGNDRYTAYQEKLRGISFAALSRKKDDAIDPDLREKVKKLRDRAKKIIKDSLAGELFAKNTDDIIYELNSCLPYAATLSDLTIDYMRRFAAAKQERGVADFSDLEHMALKILKDDETREVIKRRYKELIIDEYQDCNRVQEAIFTAISNGHNYVTVGDVKQSIYSFRDACPALFMDKYEKYDKGADTDSRLITLSKNFRSSIPVAGTVNSVFSAVMTRDCGGAVYDDSQSLHYGGIYENDYPSWKGEYLLVECDPDGSEDDVAAEARAVAARIRELTGNTDKGDCEALKIESRKDNSVHDCTYGDIVILLRSVRGVSDTFSEVFASEGIPLVFDSRSGYLLSFEIKEIMNLLTIIDNPRQDIYLAGVMMGYFGGFSPSDMVYVRSCEPGGDLYDSLRAAVDQADEEVASRCRSFLGMLDSYREKSVYTPIHELVSLIISDFHYDHYVRALSDGARREGNLRLLKKRAADYEQTSFHGLFKFLRYIENMKKYEMDFGEAAGRGAGDAVRIMSIHHSKGLEFPVVFVSTLGRRINQADSRAQMLFDDDLGAGCDLIIRDRNLKIRTLIKKVISQKKTAAAISEEMRVLYVAMTRAENKLILTTKKNEKAGVKTDPMEAGSLADFLDISIEINNSNGCFNTASDCLIVKEIPYEKKDETEDGSVRPEEAPIKRVLKLRDDVSFDEIKGILEDIRYVYPYEKSLNVPQKVSVSYIKHEEMEEKGVSIASDPRGDRVVPSAGALRGTAVHTAYENLPLDLKPDEAHTQQYLDSLVSSRKLSEEERGYIRYNDISDFLKTDICRRMREAGERQELYREQPFIISVPASDIDDEYPSEDRVMVQGIIDAFFLEDGKVVVVDYKTDRVDDSRILIDRYQAQLDYYERALRQILNVSGSEKVIYSVSLSREIRL